MKQPIMIVIILLLCCMAGCVPVTEMPAAAPTIADSGTPVLLPTPTVATVVATATVEGNVAPAEDTTATTKLHPAEQLIASFTAPVEANGDLLILYGQILDVNAAPLPNTIVEIWQTDASGVYDHPQDPGTSSRDMTFQFYGMATTDEAGWYAFRTIVPGYYEPRPRHIHFKVKQNGNTLLTSQFYFSDDIVAVQDEGMFRAVGESGNLLLLQLVQGEGLLLANGQIVVDTGKGNGTLPLTPSQAEGPYYPVVALAQYDNDLLILK